MQGTVANAVCRRSCNACSRPKHCFLGLRRYFIDGFKSAGFKYSSLNAAFIERLLCFCADHLTKLRVEQDAIERAGGLRYPLMKLVDMYFWQIGFELASKKAAPRVVVVKKEP